MKGFQFTSAYAFVMVTHLWDIGNGFHVYNKKLFSFTEENGGGRRKCIASVSYCFSEQQSVKKINLIVIL